MKRGRAIVGAIVVLLVAGAVILYFAAVPGMLAGDYRDAALPEHKKAEEALEDVYETFSSRAFGVRTRELDRAKSPEAMVRAIEPVVKRERRQIRPARKAVRKARRTLSTLDEDALFEPPAWPLIGERGDLETANEVADRERRYIRSANDFLGRYERLVDYQFHTIAFLERAAATLGTGVADLPENPQSPEEVARPVDAIASDIDRDVRGFEKHKAPAGQRRQHRVMVGMFSLAARQLRGMADAARARDLARIEALEDELDRGLERYDRAVPRLSRLLTRSTYAKSIRRLEEQAREIEERFDRL